MNGPANSPANGSGGSGNSGESIRSAKAKIAGIIREFMQENPPADVHDARSRISESLTIAAQEDYKTLSEGRQTPEGHRWEETERSKADPLARIMINSGNMLQALNAEWNQGTLSVSFDMDAAPYARFASEKRPLFKNGIPKRWVEIVRVGLVREIVKIIRQRMKAR